MDRGPLAEPWRHLAQLAGPAGVEVIHLTGTARFSAAPLTAIYAGNGGAFGFLRDLFFDNALATPVTRFATPLGLRTTPLSRTDRVGVVLTELPPLWRFMVPVKAGIRVPAWIRQEVRLPPRMDAGNRLLPRSLERETDRLVRRHGYRLVLSRSQSDARRFYRTLYGPYVRSRFGDAAVVVPEQTFLAGSRGHELAILRQDVDWAAGVLLQRRGNRLRLGWFGARTDPPPPGASEVLDVLSMRHAYTRGVRRVHMGNSRPCLTDGVVRYKRRFHAHMLPSRYPQPCLFIYLTNHSPAALECLRRQPLVSPMGTSMGVYRVPEESGLSPAIRLEPLRDRR